MQHKISMILLSLLIMGCTTGRNSGQLDTDTYSPELIGQILHRLPSADTLETLLVNETILRQQPQSVEFILTQLRSEERQISDQAMTALTSLSAFLSGPDRDDQRQVFLGQLHAALKTASGVEQQTFLINQIQMSGDVSSVDVLSPYLSTPELYEPACRALVQIDQPESGAALLASLAKAQGKNLSSIIQALGDLKYVPAAEAIMNFSEDKNETIAYTAMFSLAALGHLPARDLFESRLANADSWNNLRPLYITWLKNTGDVAANRQVISSTDDKYDLDIKFAALSNLVALSGEKALPDLMAQVARSDSRLRNAALNLALPLGGTAATGQWTAMIAEQNPECQADIIHMLGKRGDTSALAAVHQLLKSEHEIVRIACAQAAVSLDGEKSLQILIDNLSETKSAAEREAIKSALLQLPNETIIPPLSKRFTKLSARAKIVVMDIFVARKAEEQTNIMFTQVPNDSVDVRIAAINAVAHFPRAEDYDQIVAYYMTKLNSPEKKALEDFVVAIAGEIKDERKKIGPVLAEFPALDPPDRIHAINLFKRIGGEMAFNFIYALTASKIKDVKDTALRLVTAWPDRYALDPLIKLAGSKEALNYRVLALRGCLRILQENRMGIYPELAIYEQLFQVAERDEDKQMILTAMATLRSVETLQVISKYVPHKKYGAAAAQAAMLLATPSAEGEANLTSTEIAQVMLEGWQGKPVAGGIHDSTVVPEGFTSLFNGKDLTGWKGLVENPVKRAEMNEEEMAKAQAKADEIMRQNWKVYDSVLCYIGTGFDNLCTVKDYKNFELLLDWKVERDGDSGLYLRGTPQVQIWDPGHNPVGSGGLFNNQKGPSGPSELADKPIGQWNRFRIIMIGSKVTVYLNDEEVVDAVELENYWERDKPIYASGSIELQAHRNPLYFKNIFIKELPSDSAAYSGELFNGTDLTGWKTINGEDGSWKAENGILSTEGKGGGWISTTREFDNFKLDIEFRLPEGGNSGVFIRAPHEGNPAYSGMEIQVLDDYADEYKSLNPWQYTGSIYSVQAPAKRVSKPAGEWQKMTIVCNGPNVQVTLNGVQIVDANLINHMEKAGEHPGLTRRKGFIGFQDHSSKIEYRNIKIQSF